MLNNTERYAKKHGSGNSNGGTTVIINNGGGLNSVPLDLNVHSITANKGDISKLTVHSADINDANIVYLMSGDGQISKLRGDELEYTNGRINYLSSDEISTKKLTVDDTAKIKELIAEYIQSNNITTDYLTVNKQAHFFELVIDKIRSTEGTQINTAANCVIDYVQELNSNKQAVDENEAVAYYRCFWRKTDNNGRAVQNTWLPSDQAICQTFNVQTGVNYNAANKYYWILVDDTDIAAGDPKWVNMTTFEVSDTAITDYVIGFPVGFSFNVNDTQSDSYGYNCTNWNITGQISGSWNDEDNELIVTDTRFGLQLQPLNDDDMRIGLTNGTFSFTTDIPCRLNIGVYYDDDTFEFFPASDNYTDSYSITVENEAAIEAIVITSATVETFEPCNWIDLDANIKDGTSIPEAGDNIAQLGYRYAAGADANEKARASAIIIAAYNTPDSDIKPPSYAQYQNITDFSLRTHRGTYMDATGCYVKGNLVTESGNIIDITDDGFNVNVEYYQILANENPIIKPTSGTKNISFGVLYVLNGDGATLDDVDGFVLNVNNVNYTTTGVAFTVPITSNTTQIIARLYKDNKLKDELILSTVDLGTVTNGVDGDFTEFIYKINTANVTPTRPSSLEKKFSTYSNSERNGWTLTIPTADPSNDEFVYMTQRDVTHSSSSTTWGNWSTPTRITGENGINGADGEYLEFIYKRFNSVQTWSSLGDENPHNWDPVQTKDYFGPTSYEWNDHPEGVTEEYLYEYMSQRTYDGESFSYFTTPVIWSKYGENGIDGDGVEYIFYRTTDNTSPTIITSTNNVSVNSDYLVTNSRYEILKWRTNTTDEWHVKVEGDYIPPSSLVYDSSISGYRCGSLWTDEPQGVNSAYQYEWVSQRKYDGETKTWGEFSTPAIWARYPNDGTTGPTGPTGPSGDNAEGISLVPVKEVFEVRIDAEQVGSTAYEDIKGVLYTELYYAVAHHTGSGSNPIFQYLSNTGTGDINDLSQYSLEIDSDNTTGNKAQVNIDTIEDVTINGTTYHCLKYQIANYLTYTSGLSTGNYINYYYLHKNGLTDRMPTRLNVLLRFKGTSVKDQTEVQLKFKPSHLFSVTDTALNSIYQGLSGSTGPYTTTGFSQIHQQWDNINLSVNNLENYNEGTLLSNTNTEQYAFYLSNYSYAPNTPTSIQTGSYVNEWSTEYSAPNSTYMYMWISERDRTSYWGNNGTLQYTSWGSWCSPWLYDKYGSLRGVINSAQLDIKADQIQSTVSATYLSKNDASSTYATQSQLTQTASEISANVTSNIDGKLRTTGINIQDGIINLNSANTTIGGELYIHEGELISDGVDKSIEANAGSEGELDAKTTTASLVRTFVTGETFKVNDLFVEYVDTNTGSWTERVTSGVTFYLRKEGSSQVITTSTNITFTSSTAGTYYFYATYNSLPSGCQMIAWMNYTSKLSSVTEIASNGINIANDTSYIKFDDSTGEFIVETNYSKTNTTEGSYGIKLDSAGIPRTRLLNQTVGYNTAESESIYGWNGPVFSPIQSANVKNNNLDYGWITLGTQRTVAYVNYEKSTVYPSSSIDVYIFIGNGNSNNQAQTFDLSSSSVDGGKGIANGRIITIIGRPQLTVSNGSSNIVLKSTYWGGGGVTSFTFPQQSSYSMTLIKYGSIWIQIA